MRLARPVSWSWLTRNSSCSPRLSSSASWRMRSLSKTSHMRTSVTSRVACAIASARRRARSVTPCSTAASRRTSARLSRQRRQRLVTSCSGASRCAASCPNSSKASRAASLPSSGRPPDIQSATVTVAIVQIRSRLSSTCADISPWASAVRSSTSSSTRGAARAQRRAEDSNLLRPATLSRRLRMRARVSHPPCRAELILHLASASAKAELGLSSAGRNVW